MKQAANPTTVHAVASPYGRLEIKKVFAKNLLRGLLISVGIHLAVVGAYYFAQYLGEDEDNIPTVNVRILKYSDLGPPPSISAAPPPPSVAVAAAAKPTVGMPVPVPDAEVSAEQTIATQQELSSTPSPATEQMGAGEGDMRIEQDIQIDPDAEPGIDEESERDQEQQDAGEACALTPRQQQSERSDRHGEIIGVALLETERARRIAADMLEAEGG